jgi:hypothetical protein
MLRFIRHSSSSSIPKLATTPSKYNARSSAFNLKPALPDGLLFHPAPATLNPEITPKAFLPESDIRKASDLYYPGTDSFITKNLDFMPKISQSNIPKNYNLSEDDIKQLQEMRDSGATRKQMKEKFNITDSFISLVTKPNPQTINTQSKLLKAQSKKWSSKTLKARQIREIKKLQWERDL